MRAQSNGTITIPLMRYFIGLAHCQSNAALEWQARSIRLRCRDLMAACPLEGDVRQQIMDTI